MSDKHERMLRAAVPLILLCTLIATAFSGVVALKVLDVSKDVDNAEMRIGTNTQRALVALARVEDLEGKSRRRFEISTKRSRINRRLAKRAQRTATRTVTVLRQEGYPVPGVGGSQGAPGQRGATGARGIPGRTPTLAELSRLADDAVERYCNFRICSTPPTSAQIIAAIRECIISGACRALAGPKGEKGERGERGERGESPPQRPCAQTDPSLGYQCVIVPDSPPPPPPPATVPVP